MRKEYWIKSRPAAGSAGKWHIYWREGRRGGHPWRDDRLAAINTAYGAHTVDWGAADNQVKSLVKQLQAAEAPTRHRYPVADVNADLLERYWKKEYARRKITADSKRSARDALKRALAAIGSESLLSAPIEDLQEKIDSLSLRQQIRAASWLNSLLKFCGRRDRLARNPEEEVAVRYLTAEDMPKLLLCLGPERRLPAEVAFHTGLRLGEVFAVAKFIAEDRCVYVEGQMYEDGSYGPTKTRRKRFASISPGGADIMKLWLAVPEEERRRLRALEWSKLIGAAAVKAWPTEESKHITFHDLRHSYAHAAIAGGVSIDLLALSMGNSIAVCQRYYLGFSLTSELAQRIKAVWR